MLGIVAGGAESVWTELGCARDACARLSVNATVFAVNDAIPDVAGACHAVTLHFDKLAAWLGERRAKGVEFPPPIEVWSQHDNRGRAFVTRTAGEFRGSSGMLAIYSALVFGCSRVVLCGVPMNEALHFKRGKPWTEVKDYQDPWRARRDELAPRVRSYSGWTADLFGRPDDAFMRGSI